VPLQHYGLERQRVREGETGRERERVLLVEFRLATWWEGPVEVGEILVGGVCEGGNIPQ